jgi:hypothetical protein
MLGKRAVSGKVMPQRKSIPDKVRPDRSKISISDEAEVGFWTKHLGVTRDELLRAIEKVGNSAASVRKQLEDKSRQDSSQPGPSQPNSSQPNSSQPNALQRPRGNRGAAGSRTMAPRTGKK